MSLPTRRWPELPTALLSAALTLFAVCVPVEAQRQQPQPQTPKRTVREVRTPDGGRFLLIRDPQLRQIHWALASWTDGRDDPTGLPGLTAATARASLLGTWSTGSSDPVAERAALDALDVAWQTRMADQGNPAFEAALLQRDRDAAALCDPRAFVRVLAAAPAHRPEIVDRDGVAVFSLTTVEPALGEVARLIFERREQQALRGLARTWLPALLDRARDFSLHPERRVQAELLALTTPSSPRIALLETPPMLAPKRAQAMACWGASQHPRNTVHVIYGGFDLDGASEMLAATFADTSLPTPPARSPAVNRRLQSQRRSVVPGNLPNSVSLAWILPRDASPHAVAVAARWLTNDRNGHLRRKLQRKRPQLQMRAVGPWPSGAATPLLRIDATDPQGTTDLVEDLLAACREAAADELKDGQYWNANVLTVAEWHAATDEARALAVLLAERALKSPNSPTAPTAPKTVKGEEIRRILRTTFAGQAAIVEGS